MAHDFNATDQVTISPSVVFTDLDDGTGVLLELESKVYFSLNETGAFLWGECEKGAPLKVGELTQSMCSEYDVDVSAAEADVQRFLTDLAREGLVSCGG